MWAAALEAAGWAAGWAARDPAEDSEVAASAEAISAAALEAAVSPAALARVRADSAAASEEWGPVAAIWVVALAGRDRERAGWADLAEPVPDSVETLDGRPATWGDREAMARKAWGEPARGSSGEGNSVRADWANVAWELKV